MRIVLRVLGLVDFIALSFLLLSPWMSVGIVRYAAYWLILKGGFFFFTSKDLVSLVDMLAGGYIILLTIGLSIEILTIGLILFLGLKAALSIFF